MSGSRNKLIRRKLKQEYEEIDYRDGAEGMINWCNDYIYVPIYPEGSVVSKWVRIGELPDDINPETGRSYRTIWEEQQVILRDALQMENGRFKYRLVVFCWMRGEGKSLLACLIQLWKFFNWPRQQIMLGANSRDQVKFVHFDIMRDIINNSPELFAMVGGSRNLQEKEIRLKSERGNVKSLIRSISSFSGIVSNITGYTFSEIFDMKNPKFFAQLDGSIRNVPNALGVIDSTVSAKTHLLYQLYINVIQEKTTTVYFSYRSSKLGNPDDYWNPYMTGSQLNDYRAKFPFGEYERYFLNLWSAGSQRVFTEEMIEETKYLGMDGMILNHKPMMKAFEEKNHLIEVIGEIEKKGFEGSVEEASEKITDIYERLVPIDSVYQLRDKYGQPRSATVEELTKLGDIFDTNWAITAGPDFGDPYAVRGLARTILVVVAKGLPGSRSDPYIYVKEKTAPKWIYVMLNVVYIQDHSGDVVKEALEEAGTEFDGIDVLCSERYGAWDMEKWCEARDIEFQPIFPTYDRQRDAFKQVLECVREGRFKCPPLAIAGSKKEDIRDEEMEAFDHDSDKRWFGSAEKMEKYGIQDDFMFSFGWAIYGGRMLGVDDFRIRRSVVSFGTFYNNPLLVGNYR